MSLKSIKNARKTETPDWFDKHFGYFVFVPGLGVIMIAIVAICLK